MPVLRCPTPSLITTCVALLVSWFQNDVIDLINPRISTLTLVYIYTVVVHPSMCSIQFQCTISLVTSPFHVCFDSFLMFHLFLHSTDYLDEKQIGMNRKFTLLICQNQTRLTYHCQKQRLSPWRPLQVGVILNIFLCRMHGWFHVKINMIRRVFLLMKNWVQ